MAPVTFIGRLSMGLMSMGLMSMGFEGGNSPCFFFLLS